MKNLPTTTYKDAFGTKCVYCHCLIDADYRENHQVDGCPIVNVYEAGYTNTCHPTEDDGYIIARVANSTVAAALANHIRGNGFSVPDDSEVRIRDRQAFDMSLWVVSEAMKLRQSGAFVIKGLDHETIVFLEF